jgi:hypothetical protein
MIKSFYRFILGICFISWLIIIPISAIYFFPDKTLKLFNSSSHYEFEYSQLTNDGTLLNPILTFKNINVFHDGKEIFSADQSKIGILISRQIFLRRFEINKVLIEHGSFVGNHISQNTRSSLALFPSRAIEISLKNFSYINQDSSTIINGQINGLSIGSANGQLSFSHNNKVSTFSVGSDGKNSRILANLHQNKWLRLIPGQSISNYKDLNFSINFLANINSMHSSIQGSLSYEEISFNLLVLKKNLGSFVFESHGASASLSFNKFLNPFMDEQFPIHINLKNKTLIIPTLFVSNQFLELQSPKVNNLLINNLFISMKDEALLYSGKVIDLDLKDIYFNEILDIAGGFSGQDGDLKFEIYPSSSLIKDHNGQYHPLSINALGGWSDQGFDIQGKIKPLIGDLNLHLEIGKGIKNSISLKLAGQNLSKEFILVSIPRSLPYVHEFIDLKLDTSVQNKVFLDYHDPRSKIGSKLLLKFSLKSSQFDVSPDFSSQLYESLIEINKKNLYVHTQEGNINSLPTQDFNGNLNFSEQTFKHSSVHNFNYSEFFNISKSNAYIPNQFLLKGLNKGVVNISTNHSYNATSLMTPKFSVPILEKSSIDISKGNFFIVNLDHIFGILPAKLSSQNLEIILQGRDILKNYILDFSSSAVLEPSQYVPASSLITFLGKDTFSINLSIQKDKEANLLLFSQLEDIKLISNFSFLSKSKSQLLPTSIKISNLSKPSIYVKNNLLEMALNNFQDLNGFIALGRELPSKFYYIKESKGLSVYVGLDSFSDKELKSLLSAGVKSSDPNSIKEFIFQINNLDIYNNHFTDISGLVNFNRSEVRGSINGVNLNGIFRRDSTGFLKIELENSHISDTEFLRLNAQSNNSFNINSRLIVKNSSINDLQIKLLDVYLLKNKNTLTLDNINLSSNFISISPHSEKLDSYFSIDSSESLYKLRGDFMIKDSSKVTFLSELTNFSYLNGKVNLQWQDLKRLQNIEGELNFILKDLTLDNRATSSVALNLLGVFNLKNILGKVANLDLSIDEYTSTKLDRVEADLVFNKRKARLLSPLLIETNAAKMKWIGQIRKNSFGELNYLDLNLDLNVRFEENIPWYAALLGGLPAVAGSAVISEIFEDSIDDLSNYQYEVLGTITEPQIKRIN